MGHRIALEELSENYAVQAIVVPLHEDHMAGGLFDRLGRPTF
jgi:hypothetical protein